MDKVPVVIVPNTVNVVCKLYQIGSTVLYRSHTRHGCLVLSLSVIVPLHAPPLARTDIAYVIMVQLFILEQKCFH